ncbi:unnamed protein product, partial [Dibothriocephalus latus]
MEPDLLTLDAERKTHPVRANMKGPHSNVEMPQVDADLYGSGNGGLPSADSNVNADADLDGDASSKIGGIGKMAGFKEKGPIYHERIGKAVSPEFVGDIVGACLADSRWLRCQSR